MTPQDENVALRIQPSPGVFLYYWDQDRVCYKSTYKQNRPLGKELCVSFTQDLPSCRQGTYTNQRKLCQNGR